MPRHAPHPLALALALAPVSALALGVALSLSPGVAQACGGTFCDGGNPMPVDQTGEDILFIRDGDQMEVHVRIQYTGAAERFAWMVPLPAVPDVSVGSEPLFAQLAAATIPSWTVTRSFEDPNDAPPPSGGFGFAPDDSDPNAEPEVVLEDVVGAYEIVVLEGGTAAAVLEFFDSNDYAYDANAEPIIQQYLDEGFLITGVKLTAGAEVEAIHPLVFRFTSDEPCVPIRLTAVGAKQDMGIRAYFLGQERWAPGNYNHVQLNPAAYDWTNPGLNAYVELLSLAVDEAGGHAFATDYTGTSAVVGQRSTIWRAEWSQVPWAELGVSAALDNLGSIGLLPFSGPPPQVRALLRKYVPVPAEWEFSENSFWAEWFEHEELFDPLAWDGAAFAAEFEELVVEPGAHAIDMLEAWPVLTRLHTTISPAEMTLDPIFHPTPDLPEVLEVRTAGAYVFKDFVWTRYLLPFELEPDGMTAQDERVCVADDGNWPSFADMPRALRVEQVPAMGPVQVITDNEAQILALIETHNEGSPCDADPGSGGGTDDAGDSGDTGDTGGPAGEDAKGRGCTVDPIGGAGPVGLGLGLLALGLVRRRRRS